MATRDGVEVKIANGTEYSAGTPNSVVGALEEARLTGRRIRVFYGNPETGEDAKAQLHTLGYVGRSAGERKFPVIVYNKRSLAGVRIKDDQIVKITSGREILWKHPKYSISLTKGESEIDGLRDFLLGRSNRRLP